MNSKFLPLAFVMIILSSCTSRYKTTQTPDDLYYSPVNTTASEPENPQPNTTAIVADDSYYGNGYYDNYFLRHKIRHRYLWNNIDDYSYWNDTRYYHCPSNWSYYNNYYGYNSYYNGWNNYYSYGYSGYYGGYYSPYLNPYFNYGYYGYGWNNNYNHYNYNNHSNYNPGPTKTSAYSNIKTYYNQNYNNTNYSTNPQTGTTQGTNISNDKKVSRTKSSGNGSTWSAPVRTFSNPSSTPSSNTGGSSGGFNSSGSNSGKPRAGRG